MATAPDSFPVLFGEYSSFFRGVLEYFPGRTGVLSGGDWGSFRMPVPVFPQEWPGKCGNKPKKSSFAPAFERESDTDGSPRRRSGKKKEKNFRKSLAVQKDSLPLRSRSERERQEEEIFERIFIPTKVVQVSRPDGCPDRMSRQLKTGTKRQ